MSRILLMSTRELGHVNPLLGVAQWLVKKGHAVGWLCLPECPAWFAEAGIEPVAMDLPPSESAGEFVTRGPELASLARDNDRLLAWIRRLLVDEAGDMVEPARAALRAFGAGALVVDPMMYPGIIAAHCEGIPYMCPSSSLNPVTPPDLDVPHNSNMRAIDAGRRALFESFGMTPEFRVADCLSPFANAVFTTREYVGDVEVPDRTLLAGPSMPPDGRPAAGDAAEVPDDGAPLVYVSFGSQLYYQPDVFELVAEATEPLGVRVVLSCGPLALSEWANSLPPHVTAVSMAPQLEIIGIAAAVVTHGGANTVMESLYFGVPLLLSPVCNDQTMQAWFATRRGVGLTLDLQLAEAGEARRAIESLLDPESPQRAAAKEVSESYRAADGALRVAERAEEIVRGD